MVSKVTYKLDLFQLGLEDVPSERHDEVKNEIGEFLVEQILQDVGSTKSPVAGQPRNFKSLSPDYKELKSKQAPGIPNLELNGDMLDSLKFNITSDGVEIGIFDSKEAKKADNHNKFSAKSKRTKVPKRQFIPNDDESFRPFIVDRVIDIIDDFKTGDDDG